jgi:hypothetical protein
MKVFITETLDKKIVSQIISVLQQNLHLNPKFHNVNVCTHNIFFNNEDFMIYHQNICGL